MKGTHEQNAIYINERDFYKSIVDNLMNAIALI